MFKNTTVEFFLTLYAVAVLSELFNPQTGDLGKYAF